MSHPDRLSDCDSSPSTDREAAIPTSHSSAEYPFPRSSRLLSAGDYGQVFKQNKRYSDQYWTILVRRDVSRPARLGLAIAKKRAKRASDRNKLKRVVREAFRHQQALLAGLDMVVMNRDAASKATRAELRASVDALLRKMAKGGSNKRVSNQSGSGKHGPRQKMKSSDNGTAPETSRPGTWLSDAEAYRFLSALDQSLVASALPFCAKLLGIRNRGHTNSRYTTGRKTRTVQIVPLSSVSSGWIRSGSARYESRQEPGQESSR